MRVSNWMAGLSAALMLTLAAPMAVMAADGDTMPDGVYAGEQNLGGMTKEEAGQAVADYAAALTAQKITVNIGGQAVETSAVELGFSWSNQDVMDDVAAAYTGGNLIRQYMTKKDLEAEPYKVPLEFDADGAKLDAFVQEKCAPSSGRRRTPRSPEPATGSRSRRRPWGSPSILRPQRRRLPLL